MKDLRDPVLLLLLLVSLLAARGAQPRELCAGDMCLLLFTDAPLSFEGARAACEAQAGDLAPLRSPKDLDLAAGLLRPPVPAGKFWISGSGCASASTNGSWWQEPCGGGGTADGFLCAVPDGRCPMDDGRFAAPGATRAEWPPAAVGAPRTAFGRDASRYFRSAWICGGGGWLRAPWSCEVMDGGCERGCRNSTCLCPDGHALHANGVQCVTLPAAATPAPPACVVGGRGCADPNRLCVARPDGGAECACRSGYDEQDGACVDVSMCSRCEHMMCHPQVVGGPHLCACRRGFTVSLADPTRCEQRCELDECPAICVDGIDSCSCPAGYILGVRGNASMCTYLGMCDMKRPCDHLCENVRGGYTCACLPGFLQRGDTCACHPGFLKRGNRCVCHPGFLQRGDRCVATTPEPGPTPGPEPGPGPGPPSPSAAAGVPAYVRVGSALGMTLFAAGGAALLYLLLRVCVSRAGGTSWGMSGGADLDGLTLQQVTTEKYLRFDKRPSDTVDLRTVRPTLDT